MLMRSAEVRTRTWTGSSITTQVRPGVVTVRGPCGESREMSPAAAREVAVNLLAAADAAEKESPVRSGSDWWQQVIHPGKK